MAAPTPITKTFWDGTRGLTRWFAAWTDGTQLTDSVVVDVSALSPAVTAVKIRSIDLILNGDVQVDFEFDATSDELIDRIPVQSNVSYQFLMDYTDGPNNGYIPDQGAAGFAGDVLLTTTNCASGDEIRAIVIFEKAT